MKTATNPPVILVLTPIPMLPSMTADEHFKRLREQRAKQLAADEAEEQRTEGREWPGRTNVHE